MRAASILAAAVLLAGCGDLAESEINTPFADRDWVYEASRSCPALRPTVAGLDRDGSISPQDVASVAAALKVILSSPVKGQRCLVDDPTPPSMRPADDVPYVYVPVV